MTESEKQPSKGDRRVRRTRQALLQALLDLILEKRYDKITVQDIIDRADVGRSTFYSHFLDKEDLLLQGIHSFGEHVGEHLGHEVAPVEGYDPEHVVHSLAFFQHAYDNRSLYRAMFEGGGAGFVKETVLQHITVDIETHLSARFDGDASPEVPMIVITNFLAGSMMSLLTWWLEEDMPMMPAEIDSMYQRLARPSIEQFI